ncbi:hypothetical protein M885DRAFT_16331 [Pelagophyceae sp. CCMP2097]|nr:hypothetical protein M885DRAFT_16331 [Pelagophyceae sp. CCMP2097]
MGRPARSPDCRARSCRRTGVDQDRSSDRIGRHVSARAVEGPYRPSRTLEGGPSRDRTAKSTTVERPLRGTVALRRVLPRAHRGTVQRRRMASEALYRARRGPFSNVEGLSRLGPSRGPCSPRHVSEATVTRRNEMKDGQSAAPKTARDPEWGERGSSRDCRRPSRGRRWAVESRAARSSGPFLGAVFWGRQYRTGPSRTV